MPVGPNPTPRSPRPSVNRKLSIGKGVPHGPVFRPGFQVSRPMFGPPSFMAPPNINPAATPGPGAIYPGANPAPPLTGLRPVPALGTPVGPIGNPNIPGPGQVLQGVGHASYGPPSMYAPGNPSLPPTYGPPTPPPPGPLHGPSARFAPSPGYESNVGSQMGRAVGRAGGQFGTGIGVPSAAPGIRGTLSRSMLGPSGKWGGLVKGGVASAIGSGVRDRILYGGDKVLTNESSPERLASAGTLGMVGGLASGAPGVAVGAGGAALGQGLIDAAAADNGFTQWARGEQENTLLDVGNKITSAVNPLGWLASGVHAAQGGDFDPFNSTRNIIGGASKEFGDRTGDELSVANALGKVGNWVGEKTGMGGQSTVDQFAKILTDQVAQQAQKRQAAAANPATISDLARRMGMDEDAAGELGNSWAQQVEQYRVMAENGALDIEVPDPANPGKTTRRPITADELPGFIEHQFRQTISQLPEIIAEGNAARKVQEADAAAQQEALTRAFGYSVAMNQLMGADYDRMTSNPLMAPYAGLMRQSNLNLPYLIAHDQYKDAQAQYAAEQRQIAQQEAAAQRAYEMELAKLKAKQDAEAVAGALATDVLGGK